MESCSSKFSLVGHRATTSVCGFRLSDRDARVAFLYDLHVFREVTGRIFPNKDYKNLWIYGFRSADRNNVSGLLERYLQCSGGTVGQFPVQSLSAASVVIVNHRSTESLHYSLTGLVRFQFTTMDWNQQYCRKLIKMWIFFQFGVIFLFDHRFLFLSS